MKNSRRRTPALAAAVAASALVATACGAGTGGGPASQGLGNPERGGTLNMLGQGDVDYMDPNVSYYAIGYLGLRMWSRQLFTNPAIKGKETAAVPDLATQIPTTQNGGMSKDGKTYTIKLRKGVKWNTKPAREVTAEDVVRGVKRTCNPVQPFGGIPNFASLIQGYQSFCDKFATVKPNPSAMGKFIEGNNISGVQAKDKSTVVFKLTHPAAYFVDMLTLASFSPAPVEWNKYAPGSAQLAQNTLSDGPYQVESYQPTKQIVFTRNPAWDPATDPIRKAYVDKIVVNETIDQNSAQQQLQTNSANADMEWDDFTPPSKIASLMNDPNFSLGETSSSNPYVVFNTVSPNNNKALANVKFRQALMFALNRDHMIRGLGGPAVNPPLTHVVPGDLVGSKNFDLYPNDPNKAKQMMQQAGVKNPTLKVLYRNSSEGSTRVFTTLQQDLKAVGITVQGVQSPDADFYTKYLQVPGSAKKGDWDLAIAGWGSDWYGDAALSYFAPLFAGSPAFPPVGSNFGFYNSPKTNALITQASQAKTEGESSKLWAEADKQVMQDAAFFPITNPKQPNYHASQVANAVYVPTLQNYDPTNVMLASKRHGG